MKQKIILKVQLDCDKCRSKTLKIAAEAKGVSSVSLEGDDRDKLVVTGEVDAVCLARVLRKKFRCVTLQSVEDVKKKDEKQERVSSVFHVHLNPVHPIPLPTATSLRILTPLVASSCDINTTFPNFIPRMCYYRN
ncbi:hypothetical protein L6164_005367 [Bauhinia variegata]|uniref:Uncharacterized protein n=1 Tax=Bauhinia variegata TaxID=167791 RepID=A0ACB9PQA0_BAUVA|nr:hypothetical protein L6164_005367 [Bauhinia variegata]